MRRKSVIIRKGLILSVMIVASKLHGLGSEDIKEMGRNRNSAQTPNFQEQIVRGNNTEKITKIVISCVCAYVIQIGACYVMSQYGGDQDGQ